jgi:hypothetical protein
MAWVKTLLGILNWIMPCMILAVDALIVKWDEKMVLCSDFNHFTDTASLSLIIPAVISSNLGALPLFRCLGKGSSALLLRQVM